MSRFVFASRADALIAIGAATLLAGCSTTIPVAVIGQNGMILRGENNISVSGGSFFVTNGRLTCTGSYNALNESRTITIPIVCNDGRTGIAMATRDTALSGGGKVRLSDGMEADFSFGEAARRI